MRDQILTPCGFNRRLEGKNQHLGKAHLLGQLIRCKGLAEAHLSIPKKFRCAGRISLSCVLEISFSPHDCTQLLWAHLESPSAGGFRADACLQLNDGRFDITNRAVVPLIIIRDIQLFEPLTFKDCMNVMIHKHGAIFAHGRLRIKQLIGNVRGTKLFFYASMDITLCIAYLDISFMNIQKAINIDHRFYGWTLDKKFLCHYSSPPSMGLTIESMNAISSAEISYFLYSSSSVQGFEKSCLGTN